MKKTVCLATALSLLALVGCGSSSGNKTSDGAVTDSGPASDAKVVDAQMADSGPVVPTLTVNNVSAWCNVTVTVGSAAPVTFGTVGMDFSAPAGTTITLSSTPMSPFLTGVWTGTTTTSGPNATYLMTGAASQSVTVCCAEPNGTGC